MLQEILWGRYSKESQKNLHRLKKIRSMQIEAINSKEKLDKYGRLQTTVPLKTIFEFYKKEM